MSLDHVLRTCFPFLVSFFFFSPKISVLHEWNANEMYLGFICLSLEVEGLCLQGYKANSLRSVNFAADGRSRVSIHRSMAQLEIRAKSGWELHNASWLTVVHKYTEREQLNELKLKKKTPKHKEDWVCCIEMLFYFETSYSWRKKSYLQAKTRRVNLAFLVVHWPSVLL